MKRFATVVLMLCIAMMCTTPFEAQSQNRRTGGGNSGNATKKEQPVRSSGSSTKSSGNVRQSGATHGGSATRSNNGNTARSNSGTTTRNSSATRGAESRNKMTAPSGQSRNSTQSATRTESRQANRPEARSSAPQVQDRRNNATRQSSGNSHSAQISRKNSDVGRQNIPSNKNGNARPSGNHNDNKGNHNGNHNGNGNYNGNHKPSGNHNGNHNGATYHGNRKPNAVQYHNRPPRPRDRHYERPYLKPNLTPMPSYRYGDHYFGHRIHSLPHGYVTMRVGGLDYYFYDGIYYRPYRTGGYYICRPPRGTTIASTLFNVALTAIAINTIRNEIDRAQRAAELSRIYSAANSGYAVRTSDDYYVDNIASQVNQEYYYQDGVFYILENGQYYVIEAPIGALVTEIPADYEEMELDGTTYYLVENTLYKTTVIDGALYFEVVCNL